MKEISLKRIVLIRSTVCLLAWMNWHTKSCLIGGFELIASNFVSINELIVIFLKLLKTYGFYLHMWIYSLHTHQKVNLILDLRSRLRNNEKLCEWGGIMLIEDVLMVCWWYCLLYLVSYCM